MRALTRRNLALLGTGWLLATGVAAYAQLPQTQVGKVTGLPFIAGADVWVDQEGTPKAAVPGIVPGQLTKMRVMVFRPKTNGVTLDVYSSLFVEQGLLNATQQPLLNSLELPKGANQNREETFIFRAANADQLLVIGFITNVQSQNQLVYSVVLEGKIQPAAALLQAKSSVTALAERARSQRLTPAPPAGSTAVGPTSRLTGALLVQLLQAITQNPKVPQPVKKMCQVVIPQSTSITYTKWRTASPLADPAFVDYYVGQAGRMGWGKAVVVDVSQPGIPTLLFQLPDGGGVVMLRGQPSAATAVAGATTEIVALVMEGHIDVSALK